MCTWKQCSGEGGCYDETWETDCDNMFTLNEGTPSDNRMKFCCFCGGELVEVLADDLLLDY